MNKLFNDVPVKVTVTLAPPPPIGQSQTNVSEVKLDDIKNYIGKEVKVKGKVYSSKDIGSMVLINLGAAYPNQMLTVALKGNAKSLASQIDNKMVTVQGTVIEFKGKPEIVINDTNKFDVFPK